jgi:uncharacterized protein (UPF0276 family)
MPEPVPSVGSPCGPQGIGLRDAHVHELLTRLSNGDDSIVAHAIWVEVHSENYLEPAPIRRQALTAIAQHLPISLHGVGMSFDSPAGMDPDHLSHTRQLVAELSPTRISEHACWSSLDGIHFDDLLPLPFTEEALTTLTNKVNAAQKFLSQPILIENLAAYLAFDDSTMPESIFLSELCRRNGCGLLLDLNDL